jgi:diguanylate cyclase (GGDEF)-like protein
VQLLEFKQVKEYKCTISVGVYSANPNTETNLQQFIDNADQALYKAKASGRNCVMSFD